MTDQTQTWVQKDKKQLHPVYHPKSHANPLVVERGEGVWLYTTDGQKILDGMAGLWNVNVGYGREELAQATYDQMKELAFTSNFSGMTNLPSIKWAEKLAGFAYEGLNTTFFTSGGSESKPHPITHVRAGNSLLRSHRRVDALIHMRVHLACNRQDSFAHDGRER